MRLVSAQQDPGRWLQHSHVGLPMFSCWMRFEKLVESRDTSDSQSSHKPGTVKWPPAEM